MAKQKVLQLKPVDHATLGRVLAARGTDNEGDNFEVFVAGTRATLVGRSSVAVPTGTGPTMPTITGTVELPPGTVGKISWGDAWRAVKKIGEAVIGGGGGKTKGGGGKGGGKGGGTKGGGNTTQLGGNNVNVSVVIVIQ